MWPRAHKLLQFACTKRVYTELQSSFGLSLHAGVRMHRIVLLTSALFLISCSDTEFDAAQNGHPSPATETGDSNGSAGPKTGSGLNSTEMNLDTDPSDDAAVAQCLTKFGSHPFGQRHKYNYRKIAASVQVLGVGNAVVDTVATPEPSLILISAGVSVLGQTNYQLLNPNGWYCLKVSVNVLTNLNINLHCKAKLADNKVDVNVGSNSQPVGQVGVHVGSGVKVTPSGC